MSSRQPAIRVENLGKCYQVYANPKDRLRQAIMPRLRAFGGFEARQYYREFWALRGVSLEVAEGETVGIIGRNGSGKSTLLQMICGTLDPSEGTVETQGRVAALLELGAGFNPEFTGRENVFMNASVLGLEDEEIADRFDDIAAFADIGEFIDQPVKHYSSGMYARLAFAVAISVDAKILIVDEALAVGDEPFQRKCFARIEEIKKSGGSILLVSHAIETIVNLCDRAILIHEGEMLYSGAPKLAGGFYNKLMNASIGAVAEVKNEIRCSKMLSLESQQDYMASQLANSVSQNQGNDFFDFYDERLHSESVIEYAENGARIHDIHLETLTGIRVNNLRSGNRYKLVYGVDILEKCSGLFFFFALKSIDGSVLGGGKVAADKTGDVSFQDGGAVVVMFEFDCIFLAGTYFINCGVVKSNNVMAHRILDAICFKVVQGAPGESTGLLDFRVKGSFTA